MKKSLIIGIFLCLATEAHSAELCYRLEYQICGSAISRLLFFFPLRVYYDTSASIQFKAYPQPGGKTRFVFESIPRSAYLLRTLGFGGKTLALLTADTDESRAGQQRERILALWQKEAPEFARRIKGIRQFPHVLVKGTGDGLSFTRDSGGRYGDFLSELEPRYVHHPSRTEIYFYIFPMLGDLLSMLNHPFTPSAELTHASRFPDVWNGDWLDFSRDLNRLSERLEKVVKSLVTVKQKSPFRLSFRVHENGPEEVEICGEAFPDVPLWKTFLIREAKRRVRVRLADGALLLDELWVGIRNSKGQGGFGRLQLKLINETEDNR